MSGPKAILAMPSLCDSTDFGLSDEASNRKELRGLIYNEPEPILVRAISQSLLLLRKGTVSRGFYFVHDLERNLIVYYMEYGAVNTGIVGHETVTQTAVWRAGGAGLPAGFVSSMVFNHLLHDHEAVMSDQIQTERGKDLWIDLMGQALTKGLQVALIDALENSIYQISTQAEFRLWLTDMVGPWSWMSPRHEAFRFVIYKKD